MNITLKTLLTAVTLAATSSVFATSFSSQAGQDADTWCFNNDGAGASAGQIACQTIAPADPWAEDPNGGLWISTSQTGKDGTVLDNGTPNDGGDWFMGAVELFTLTVESIVTLDIWADDTAFVGLYLGDTWASPTWETDGVCADGLLGIGCTQTEGRHFSKTLAAGSYAIVMLAYQNDNGPAGLLYSGSTAAVPEPGSLALLGLGLAGLGYSRRKQS